LGIDDLDFGLGIGMRIWIGDLYFDWGFFSRGKEF